ncbi:hypothetical protein GF327_04360 [Candidatus Woesearchaeota archaeon]|nr:hypothetical protein [Candidatus Woesearchaeota archaeon]
MRKIAFIEIGEDISRNWCPNLIYALVKRDLEKKGHKCDIIRLSKNEIIKKKKLLDEFKKFLKKEKYDLIGIQSSIFVFVSGFIKKSCPNTKILLGGSNSIASVDKKDYDFLIHGPARESILKLVNYLDGKEKLSNIPNLFYKKNRTIFHTSKIKNFDLKIELTPFHPDFDRINFGVMKNNKITTANIVSSLGCPFTNSVRNNPYYKNVKFEIREFKNLDNSALEVVNNYYNKIGNGCSFCNICTDRDFNTLPEKKLIPFLIDQVKYLTENYPSIERIQINDENSFRYIDKFFEEMKSLNIKQIEFLVGGRADYFLINISNIKQALSTIKNTDFVLNIACIGFENFSQKELDIYNKGTTVKQNVKTLEEFKKLKQNLPNNFRYKKDRDHGMILFNPWTTIKDLKTNLHYIKKYEFTELLNPLSFLANYRLAIYPYTPVYFKAKKEKRIIDQKNMFRYGSVNWRFKNSKMDFIYRNLIQYCRSYNNLPNTKIREHKVEIEFLEKF